MEETEKKTFWQRHGNKVLTAGLILLTGGVVYFASQEGFKSVLDRYENDVPGNDVFNAVHDLESTDEVEVTHF